MARNDVVLLDSLVSKARPRFGARLEDGELFELFCFEQLLKDYDPSYEELESGWTDGTNDGGIDGFFLLIDGNLATEDALKYASRNNPNIQVFLFSVRHSDSFQQEPLNALIGSVPEIFDLRKDELQLEYPFAEDVLIQRALFRKVFVALADRHPTLSMTIYYCCRGDSGTLANNLTTRAGQLRGLVRSLFSEVEVAVEFKGATELLELARRQPAYSLRLKFTESYISREGRNYIVLARLPDYFDFITDEQGHLRRYLFESNVRDYLGQVQINRDIRLTLENRSAPIVEDFWWLNNGVTIIASHATVVGKEISLENVQIVNGLQTTETIYQYFSGGAPKDDDRAILLKAILTSDDATRGRIIKATNYQNTVDLASLRGLDKIQQDIDHYLLDHGWFYDRRKNLYKNMGKPAERIVSIPYLAAAVRAVALRDPARSQRQRSRSLRDEAVYAQVFNSKWDLNVYLASLEITSAVESILHQRRTVFETPPIALVHYVSYIYACDQLRTSKYSPSEVSQLAGSPPDQQSVSRIRTELIEATGRYAGQGRRFEGILLNKTFFATFVEDRYGSKAGVGPKADRDAP